MSLFKSEILQTSILLTQLVENRTNKIGADNKVGQSLQKASNTAASGGVCVQQKGIGTETEKTSVAPESAAMTSLFERILSGSPHILEKIAGYSESLIDYSALRSVNKCSSENLRSVEAMAKDVVLTPTPLDINGPLTYKYLNPMVSGNKLKTAEKVYLPLLDKLIDVKNKITVNKKKEPILADLDKQIDKLDNRRKSLSKKKELIKLAPVITVASLIMLAVCGCASAIPAGAGMLITLLSISISLLSYWPARMVINSMKFELVEPKYDLEKIKGQILRGEIENNFLCKSRAPIHKLYDQAAILDSKLKIAKAKHQTPQIEEQRNQLMAKKAALKVEWDKITIPALYEE